MNLLEKINIYVPDYIGYSLENDAFMFEILKKDGYTINKNKFLSMLILGYSDFYIEEYQKTSEALLKELNLTSLSIEEKQQLTHKILKNVILPVVPSRKSKHPVRLSLKPTKETKSTILKIMDTLSSDDSISQYFCRLFMSYCEKPFCIREQILFKDTFESLQNACKKHRPITFTTKWNETKIHEVIPYKMAVGKEELFNYLICQEYNKETEQIEAQCYRLNRINSIRLGNSLVSLSQNTIIHMDKMIKYGPQFAINDDDESCVKLSDEGVITYNRIYYGRPSIDYIEKTNDGNYYFFNCSKTQLFLYFKKFNPGEAEVLYPKSLREMLIDFHKKTLDLYFS